MSVNAARWMLASLCLALVFPFPVHNAVAPASARTPADDADTELIAINDQRLPAGALQDGVLAIRLEVREGMWFPEGADGVGVRVYAFAEEGGKLSNPGPLIRVPQGTMIDAHVRNSLEDDTITIYGMGDRSATDPDTFRLAPGEARAVRFAAHAAGTFHYSATSVKSPVEPALRPYGRYGADSQLNGAIIVDDPGLAAVADDRPFLISWWFQDPDSVKGLKTQIGVMVINGLAWPHTERFDMMVGDTLRWRWINLTAAPHPMHLHGFYFRVDARGTNARDTLYSPDQQRLAVTERLGSGETMAITWSPERPGNWVFHCHFAFHISPNVMLAGKPELPVRGRAARLVSNVAVPHGGESAHAGEAAHAEHRMAGLVLGIHVASKPGASVARPHAEPRRIRLLVRSAPNRLGDMPGYSYVLHEDGEEPGPEVMPVPGTPLILERGKPVAITVVNRSHEAASVHWHGIELESYADGVPDFSGNELQTLRSIPAGDSLLVEFTSPRTGTFMYHSHFNEMQQLGSGLYAPLLVLEPGTTYDPDKDRIFLFSRSAPREGAPVMLNGSIVPAPIELRAGETYRFRFLGILDNGGTPVRLLENGEPVMWRAIAKDGADLPPSQAVAMPARFRILAGEIYDYEFTPAKPGDLVLQFSSNPRVFTAVDVAVRVR